MKKMRKRGWFAVVFMERDSRRRVKTLYCDGLSDTLLSDGQDWENAGVRHAAATGMSCPAVAIASVQ
jgi:hypothetical protein